MVDYEAVLWRSVRPSPKLLIRRELRRAVYKHAVQLLDHQLREYDPPKSSAEIESELRKLVAAALAVEKRAADEGRVDA